MVEGDRINDIGRLINQYGGDVSDWAKKYSSNYKSIDGKMNFEIHWYENVNTKIKYELKSKIHRYKK